MRYMICSVSWGTDLLAMVVIVVGTTAFLDTSSDDAAEK